MSNYYKEEDLQRALSGFVRKTGIDEKPFDYAVRVLDSLPTIEVSEEVLKATKKFNCYTIADENAEMGMRTQIEPVIEVSEDCISREWLISFIDAGHLRNPNEKCYSENDVVELIKNAPSVIPQQKEGEWIFQECNDESYGRAYECSICGVAVVGNHHNYCPNCGAKMKG